MELLMIEREAHIWTSVCAMLHFHFSVHFVFWTNFVFSLSKLSLKRQIWHYYQMTEINWIFFKARTLGHLSVPADWCSGSWKIYRNSFHQHYYQQDHHQKDHHQQDYHQQDHHHVHQQDQPNQYYYQQDDHQHQYLFIRTAAINSPLLFTLIGFCLLHWNLPIV